MSTSRLLSPALLLCAAAATLAGYDDIADGIITVVFLVYTLVTCASVLLLLEHPKPWTCEAVATAKRQGFTPWKFPFQVVLMALMGWWWLLVAYLIAHVVVRTICTLETE